MSEIRLPLPQHAWRFDLLLAFARRIAFPARMLPQGDSLWRYTCGRLVNYGQRGDAIIIRGEWRKEEESAIARQSRRLLGIDRDLSEFYALAAGDLQLWSVVEPLVGLPLFCAETVFEALITLIIEQHISWQAALRAQRTLLRLFYDGCPVAGGRVYDFPSPAQLAAASPAQLKALKITDRRCALLTDLARQVDSGALDLEALRVQEDDEAFARLLRIKGVGAWTAGNVIGRAFGRYPHLASKDVALQAAVREYFCGGDGVKSAALVEEALGAYGDCAGMAGHFTLLRWVLDRYPPQLTSCS